MQEDIISALENSLSIKRLEQYQLRENHEKKEHIVYKYIWNTNLSKELYPTLSLLEITLRNTLHNAISAEYEKVNWYEGNLVLENDFAIKSIEKVKNTLRKSKKPLESDRIIAELSFGFWTSLFDKEYERNKVLWPKLLKYAFPHIPRSKRTRKELSRILNQIRNLRNRIFHYEPIWHWKDLAEQHCLIRECILWINPNLEKFINTIDNFEKTYTGKWDQYINQIN